MDNITSLSDEELETLVAAATEELGRRLRLSQVPADITASVLRYVADGGDPEEIRAALTEAFPTT